MMMIGQIYYERTGVEGDGEEEEEDEVVETRLDVINYHVREKSREDSLIIQGKGVWILRDV